MEPMRDFNVKIIFRENWRGATAETFAETFKLKRHFLICVRPSKHVRRPLTLLKTLIHEFGHVALWDYKLDISREHRIVGVLEDVFSSLLRRVRV